MPWEKVESGTRGAGSTELMISMRKSGSIGFNRLVMEEHIEDASHIEVYYNEDENKLAFKPLEDGTDASYTISISNDTGSITPMGLLNKYQLEPDITTRYEPEVEEVDGEDLITIDLNDPEGTYGKPKEENEEE